MLKALRPTSQVLFLSPCEHMTVRLILAGGGVGCGTDYIRMHPGDFLPPLLKRD